MATAISADTRARILEAAFALVRERGTGAVSVKDVAAAAGVSRQLVYFHYENRAGLLVAMARHHDRRSGFIRRVVATRELAPAESLEALLREWCAYIPEILPVVRALEAAWMTGDEGAHAWRDRMDDLRTAIRIPMERIAGDGGLADGWTVETATDWVWAAMHPSRYENLVELRGWTPAEFTERVVPGLLAEVLA